eukprot:355559-Chlamydomonas_euryale.AAC.1
MPPNAPAWLRVQPAAALPVGRGVELSATELARAAARGHVPPFESVDIATLRCCLQWEFAEFVGGWRIVCGWVARCSWVGGALFVGGWRVVCGWVARCSGRPPPGCPESDSDGDSAPASEAASPRDPPPASASGGIHTEDVGDDAAAASDDAEARPSAEGSAGSGQGEGGGEAACTGEPAAMPAGCGSGGARRGSRTWWPAADA